MVVLERWNAEKATGKPYFPPTYEQDGFIHLTADPNLLLEVANHFYTEVPGEWVVLQLDPTKLKAEVKFEAAAPVGEKESFGAEHKAEEGPLFPHLYGTIDYDSVSAMHPMRRDAQGKFLGIEGL